MYESFFGFASAPFGAVPQAEFFVPTEPASQARETLARCIDRAEGAGVLIGPPGTGKSLVCQLLAQQFAEDFQIVVLNCGRLSSRKALLQAILYGLSLPFRGMDEGELRLALVDHLSVGLDEKKAVLLLVDEAHILPLRLLEEIRLITNLVRDGNPRLRVVLTGTAALEERFASAALELFSQRLAARCYLASLSLEETEQYVRGRVSAAQADPEALFTPEAYTSIYQATDGIPRLVNQLCDHALILAYTTGKKQLDPAIIEEAWADLQQLPPLWNAAPAAVPRSTDGVIEFGGLDDDPVFDEISEHESIPFRRKTDDLETVESPQASAPMEEPEDTFHPAGTIGPEIELVLDEAPDPFAEPFEEEEVLVDPRARLQGVIIEEREGLEGHGSSFVAMPSETNDEQVGTSSLVAPMASESMEENALVESEDSQEPGGYVGQPLAEFDTEGVDAEEVVEASPPGFVPTASTEEVEEIVVLDRQPGAPIAEIEVPLTQVVQHEYSELFAKLRHG